MAGGDLQILADRTSGSQDPFSPLKRPGESFVGLALVFAMLDFKPRRSLTDDK